MIQLLFEACKEEVFCPAATAKQKAAERAI